MWIPYGTAERDCCHCQQDTALSLLTPWLGEGLQGLSSLSVLSYTVVLEEEKSVSLILDSEPHGPHSVEGVGREQTEGSALAWKEDKRALQGGAMLP